MISSEGVGVGEPPHSGEAMLGPLASPLFYKCSAEGAVCRLWITARRRG